MYIITFQLFTLILNRPKFNTNIRPNNIAKSCHIPNSANSKQIAITITDTFTGVLRSLKKELSPNQATNTTKSTKLKA